MNSQVGLAEVGNTRPLRGWNANIVNLRSSHALLTVRRLHCVHKAVQGLRQAVPSSDVFRISSHLFRVLLLRRLRLPLPPVSRSCRCGRALYSRGHHRR